MNSTTSIATTTSEQNEPATRVGQLLSDVAPGQIGRPNLASIDQAELPIPSAMSKSQAKKLKRRQLMLERRKELRVLEREKKRQKRKEAVKLKQQRQQSGHVEPQDAKPKRPILMKDSQNKTIIVIDMDFESFMSPSEIHKSVQQVGRIYSANRRSQNPFQLYITSLKGNIRDRCLTTNTGFQNWDINCSEVDYENCLQQTLGKQYDKTGLIYLTGDSDNTLPSVDELLKDDASNEKGCLVFVLGGLVDHNRHKNLCQSRATQRSIATARLPIQEYMKLNQRTILSTVTVFEILLQALAMRMPWPEALRGAMPKRKIAEIYDSTISTSYTNNGEGGDDTSDDEEVDRSVIENE